MENRRGKQPKMKWTWIWEGDVRKFVFKEKRCKRRKERGNKDRTKETQRACHLERGWWRPRKRTWSLRREHSRKKGDNKLMRNREGLWKRALGGGGKPRAQHLSYIAGHRCYVSQIITVIKKQQNCRENGVNCHNLKAKHQTQEKEKEKPRKKRNTNEEHKNNEDINNRKTRRSQMKGTWVSKGMGEKCVERTAAKMKKG